MPISHPHKVIFVHIPRACGSSIEKTLGVYGLTNDGMNYPYPAALFGRYEKILLQHLLITEIRDRVERDVFDRYFKFAIVRNPFDRIISEYFWSEEAKKMNMKELLLDIFTPTKSRAMELYRARHDGFKFRAHRRRLTFKEFLYEIALPNKGRPLSGDMDRHFKSQYRFITGDDGKLLVDFVGRYENLEEDIASISGNLDLELDLSGVNRSKHGSYRDYYDDESREIVHDLYREDIEMFGYEF